MSRGCLKRCQPLGLYSVFRVSIENCDDNWFADLYLEVEFVNAYALILIGFVVAGGGASFWAWRNMMRGRAAQAWPKVEGTIIESRKSDVADDAPPVIVFSYQIEGKEYTCQQPFSDDMLPFDVVKSYLEKYPAGAQVGVYYQPAQPVEATLEPGNKRDDWFLFVACLLATLFGLLLLLSAF